MDWVHRVGPVCPYGDRVPTPLFPEPTKES
jgi:hypothetical protein